LIIPLIIQTIGLDPSGAVWTDEASNVSRPDRSAAVQIDAEHQATDLVVLLFIDPDPGFLPVEADRPVSIVAAQRPIKLCVFEFDPGKLRGFEHGVL
jgi:hypothetical protein